MAQEVDPVLVLVERMADRLRQLAPSAEEKAIYRSVALLLATMGDIDEDRS